jgi:hypothetical protein
MRANQFHEIIQDAELANAIGPIARKHRLSVEQTTRSVAEVWCR